MNRFEEERIREESVGWYRNKVLMPLNHLVVASYFQFPLPAEYFGSRKLGLRFREGCFTLTGYSSGDVALSYDITVFMPFTLPSVVEQIDLVCNDSYTGVGHVSRFK